MSTPTPDLPAPLVLMKMVQGVFRGKALQAAAELGIADLIAGEPLDCTALASATQTHAGALYRLLRALASEGIFREDEQGRFANTPLSQALRSDHPGSVRDYVIYAPHDGNVRAWMELMSVLRTGRPSFAAANGTDVWGYFGQHPEVGQRFDRAMAALSAASLPTILGAYDFGQFERVLDVGGGQGLLLAALLRRHTHLRAALLDRPEVIARARPYLQAQGVAARCECLPGDMFGALPPGYDAYILKDVLEDWDDDQALALLAHCRAAMPARGKLVAIDAVMQPGNAPHPAKWFDLHMMVALGGRERTEPEFAALLARAGFRLTLALPLPGLVGIVEAVPV